ncbi:MAG: glyoxalase/bleomycin resistance/extradiol dioxygenase family protein [Opitutus sp.]|nr:glyoxalase/bleomycin resistance/extradiol dioxygenase family protein [Opitutus sp.]
MKIEHLALWTANLERARRFYETYLGAQANELYHNPRTGFRSYFLKFAGGARLELMQRADIAERSSGDVERETLGLAHFAVSLGSEAAVDGMTERFRRDGLRVVSAPRRTGDGYYESVVLDPDGNRIELTV